MTNFNTKLYQYNKLIKLIKDANDAYYLHNQPIMTDYEFDMKLKELQQMEFENPEFISPSSPTQYVGSDLSIQKEFKQVTRTNPMGSIENCYDIDELKKWMSKFSGDKFIIEWKKDGTSCSLIYKNGVLVEASTRGDGYTGDNIIENVKTIKNIPQVLNCPYIPIKFEVRGEILIKRDKFKEINDDLIANGKKPYANCRNLAAGSIKQLDPKVTASRDLIFIPYAAYAYPDITEGDIVNTWCDQHLYSQSDIFETLRSLGFYIDDYYTSFDINDIISHLNEFKDKKKDINWDNDGIVIKLDYRYRQNEVGYTQKNPKFALAYKWSFEMASTKLLDIEWQIGRTGKLTPVGKFEPVEVDGSVISNVMLNNIDFINEKNVAIGAYYFVYKGGSVIPVLFGPDEERNKQENIEIKN